MKPVEIKGIIPPVITPMDPRDESVNIPALRDQIERQIAAGAHGIFPFGTNGEAYILSMKEKEEILEAAVDQVKGRVPVYAGTGCISTRDTVYLSKRAEALGAEKLILLTGVRGLLRDPGDESTLIPELQLSTVPALVREGVITGEMVHKVDCCVHAVRSGVCAAVILDGRVSHCLLTELLTDAGVGTMLTN